MTTFSRAGLAAAATRASPGIAPRETRDAARCAYVARETRATSRGGRARLGASRGGSRPVRALLGDQEVRSPPARHPSTRAASLSRATSPSRDHHHVAEPARTFRRIARFPAGNPGGADPPLGADARA